MCKDEFGLGDCDDEYNENLEDIQDELKSNESDKQRQDEDRLDVRQLALIQAIADNKAAKRSKENKTFFRIGSAIICLNLIAAIVALFLGCHCKNDIALWEWLIFGGYVAILIIIFVLNWIEHAKGGNKKSNEDIDQRVNSRNMPLDEVLQMYRNDTAEIDQQKNAAQRTQIITAIITVISTILAITLLAIF